MVVRGVEGRERVRRLSSRGIMESFAPDSPRKDNGSSETPS